MADSIAIYSHKTRNFLTDGLESGLGGLLKGVLYRAVKTAHDQASISNAAMGSFTITATGVQIGDACIWAGASLAAACVAGVFYYACVSAANTITVSIYNVTGGALDMASQTFNVLVIPMV